MSIIDDIKNLDLSKYERPKKMRRRSSSPTQHPTKTCAAILKIYRDVGYDLPGPDENYRIRRVYAGHHQKSAGAWSWMLWWEGEGDRPLLSFGDMGSRWPAAECIKQPCEVYANGLGHFELIPQRRVPAVKTLLVSTAIDGQISILVPKKRGTGYLKTPFYHQPTDLSEVEAEIGYDLWGLDGSLDVQLGGRYRGKATEEQIERVMPPICAYYGMDYRVVSDDEFWQNHPIEGSGRV